MKMAESSSKSRKRWGKRRNCLLQVISPFPIVFSKDLYCKQVKQGGCLGKGLYTDKPVLEITCIMRPPASRDHCSDTTTLLKSN